MGAESAVREAITTFHDLLTDAIAAESQGQLDEQLRRRNLFFGDRALCTVLRPRFFTVRQYDFLQERSSLLLAAFAKVYGAAINDSSFRSRFGLSSWEEELVHSDPGFRDPSPTSRLDAFFVDESSGGGLEFTEYNAETPAGPAYADELSDVFLGLPIMREFLRHYEVRTLPSRHGVLHALIDAYHQWAGRRERPHIAILDWREVPTYNEFLLFRDYFTSQGVDCVIADPREVEYSGGRLMSGETRVTLIYKRVLLSELVERGGLDHPVIRAVRERAVCMVNPFRCKILHKKASLAMLSDERNAALFTRDEHEVIERHIPWTRNMEERRTTHCGKQIDLVPFVQENRERLVLKPNDEYGGKGIVLGWEVNDSRWAEAMRTALAEPHIVQERIDLPSEPYPSWVDGGVQLLDRMLDTAPFVSYGSQVDGCMTRLSTAALLNVTAGGGSTVPIFVIANR